MPSSRDRAIYSELVGTIVDVWVEIGDEVVLGAELALMESMKMEIPICSDSAGVVAVVHAAPGLVVQADECLFTISPPLEDAHTLEAVACSTETFPAWS